MFVIKVKAPITTLNVQTGYFRCCYRCKPAGEDGSVTFIAFTDLEMEKHKIKKFKTYKQAENKIKFLKEKIEKNAYMYNWTFEIEEVINEHI